MGLLLALFVGWSWQADDILALCREWASSWRGFVAANAALCWLAVLCLGSVAINCPVPVAALVKVLAGYFFGVTGGFTLNVAMSLVGGLLGFTATRHWFYHALYSRFARPLAQANLEIARNGFWYVLSARLLMVTPFFLVNILAGLSSIRKRKFLAATGLGVLPSSAIYALSGDQLETIRSVQDFASPRFALVMTLLAVAAVVPALFRRFSRRSS